jgi:hypothetical protein
MTEDLRKAALAAALAEAAWVRDRTGNALSTHETALDDFRKAFTPHAILALYAELDAAIARAEKAEGERDGWRAKAEAAWERSDETFIPILRLSQVEASLAAVTAERDAVRELLKRGARPIRWEPSQGWDGDAIRAHARSSETYKHGDVTLLIVNQGDYLMRQLWESEVAEAIKEPTNAE